MLVQTCSTPELFQHVFVPSVLDSNSIFQHIVVDSVQAMCILARARAQTHTRNDQTRKYSHGL